jgi:hypothetical protein
MTREGKGIELEAGRRYAPNTQAALVAGSPRANIHMEREKRVREIEKSLITMPHSYG